MRFDSFFKRFILMSFGSFIFIAALLSFFTISYIRNSELIQTLDLTRVTARAVILQIFEDKTLLEAFDSDELDRLSLDFEILRQEEGIIEIRLWDVNGRLLYSEQPELIGKEFIHHDELVRALNREEVYSIEKAEKEENIMLLSKSEKFIEIYYPIIVKDEVIGIFEIYRSYKSTETAIRENVVLILMVLVLGLSLLYAFILKIIYNGSNKMKEQTEHLIEVKNELLDSNMKLDNLFISTIISITKAVDARDAYTAGHSKRVTTFAMIIGKAMSLNESSFRNLELASMFHDIGKLGIPESILNKPGKLSAEEYAIIKDHPSIGESIIESIDELSSIFSIVRHHHEKYDGSGYPDGLIGEGIPLEARIITLADAFDAMTSDRPYRKGLSFEAALKEVVDYSGTQFDPDIVEVFLGIKEETLMNDEIIEIN